MTGRFTQYARAAAVEASIQSGRLVLRKLTASGGYVDDIAVDVDLVRALIAEHDAKASKAA
jgi:hypothetical protein